MIEVEIADVQRGWRVGRKVGRTIYVIDGGEGQLIGVMDTPELAETAVRQHNDALRLDAAYVRATAEVRRAAAEALEQGKQFGIMLGDGGVEQALTQIATMHPFHAQNLRRTYAEAVKKIARQESCMVNYGTALAEHEGKLGEMRARAMRAEQRDKENQLALAALAESDAKIVAGLQAELADVRALAWEGWSFANGNLNALRATGEEWAKAEADLTRLCEERDAAVKDAKTADRFSRNMTNDRNRETKRADAAEKVVAAVRAAHDEHKISEDDGKTWREPVGDECPECTALALYDGTAAGKTAPDSLLVAVRELVAAALAYDAAIRRRASDGSTELDPRGAIAEGADLDALYFDWIDKARRVDALVGRETK